jgi:hypothetical protein
MEPRDYENIKFILSKTPAELLVWWNSLDDEDRLYAVEIVKAYRRELMADIANADLVYDDVPMQEIETELDTKEARNYLKKFQLKK